MIQPFAAETSTAAAREPRAGFAWPTPPYVLLEDRLADDPGGWLFAEPREIVRCEAAADVAAAFERIEQGLAAGLHAAGCFAYELFHALEPKLAPLAAGPRQEPLLWFGLFPPPVRLAARSLDAAFAELAPPTSLTDLARGHDAATHAAKVREILRLIRQGDAYQVNLTFPLDFRYAGDPLSLYAALRAGQPAAHGGVAALGDRTVLSVSPELWLQVSDGRAITRPMKGTCARGPDSAADQIARDALAADPKQRAENLMIVDLLRNDLARVSMPGSVAVPALFTVETYPSFHALTSTITSTLASETSLRERVAALFPCGSVVGAPKIRAAEIIAELEAGARGVYTGALGSIAPNRDMAFNVAIRTAVLTPDGAGRYGVGGGVVADSDPAAEYAEAQLKARVLTDLAEDFGLIETFRWSRQAGFVRLDGHLRRLADSARGLGFVFDPASAEQALDRLADSFAPIDQRVRLQLARDGALAITHAPIIAIAEPLRVGLAAERLDAGDPFLRHKTTRREPHEAAFGAAAARGLDEAVLLNRYGEVADASRNSLFVEVAGRLLTPPLAAGALPGVLRAELIAAGQAVEAEISLKQLRSAPIRLGNSLHGLRRARLADEPFPMTGEHV